MFRFRLSTLFICFAVAFVVFACCKNFLVRVPAETIPKGQDHFVGPDGVDLGVLSWPEYTIPEHRYVPQPEDVTRRLLWAEPLAFITTLLAIKGVRKIWRSIPRDKNRDSSSDPLIG